MRLHWRGLNHQHLEGTAKCHISSRKHGFFMQTRALGSLVHRGRTYQKGTTNSEHKQWSSRPGYLPDAFVRGIGSFDLYSPIDIRGELQRAAAYHLQKSSGFLARKIYEELLVSLMSHKDTTERTLKIVLAELEERYDLNAQHYNVMVEFHLTRKPIQYEKAFKVLEKMCELEFAKDLNPACVVIARRCHPYSEDTCSEEFMVKLLQFVEKHEVPMDNDLFRIIFDGFSKYGRIDDLKRMMKKALQWKVTPDVACYNSLIQAYADVGNCAEALICYSELTSQEDRYPTVRTIMKMLNAVCRAAAAGQKQVNGMSWIEIINVLNDGLRQAPDITDHSIGDISLTTIISAFQKTDKSENMVKALNLLPILKEDDNALKTRDKVLIFERILKTAQLLLSLLKDETKKEAARERALEIVEEIHRRRLRATQILVESYLSIFHDWELNRSDMNCIRNAFSILERYDSAPDMYRLRALSEAIVDARVGSKVDENKLFNAIFKHMGVRAISDEELEHLLDQYVENEGEFEGDDA